MSVESRLEMIKEMVQIYNSGIYSKYYEPRRHEKIKLRNAKAKEWQQGHREYFSEYNHRDYVRAKDAAAKRRRRKLIRDSGYEYTDNDWAEALFYFGYRCAYCGEEVELHQDHLFPLNSPSDHYKYNIVPSCARCNSSKSNFDFFAWYTAQLYYTEERKQRIIDYAARALTDILTLPRSISSGIPSSRRRRHTLPAG